MAHSYAYLCRKAGLPPPGEAAPRPLYTRRRRKTREEEMAWLHAELEAMVARGELYKTPDGRYGLPEWLSEANPSNASTAGSSSPLTSSPAITSSHAPEVAHSTATRSTHANPAT